MPRSAIDVLGVCRGKGGGLWQDNVVRFDSVVQTSFSPLLSTLCHCPVFSTTYVTKSEQLSHSMYLLIVRLAAGFGYSLSILGMG